MGPAVSPEKELTAREARGRMGEVTSGANTLGISHHFAARRAHSRAARNRYDGPRFTDNHNGQAHPRGTGSAESI